MINMEINMYVFHISIGFLQQHGWMWGRAEGQAGCVEGELGVVLRCTDMDTRISIRPIRIREYGISEKRQYGYV